MNRNDNDGATDTPDQLGVTSLHQNRRPTVRRQGTRRRESDTIDDETSVLSRENFAAAREDAADLREGKATSREDAVYLRESTATSRELEICVAEAAQAASDDHMIILQQANSHLVVATIEAQKLTEQVEIAKIQLENAKCMAEKSNFAKSDFLSSMSHELRTPLNAILGFAQLLETGSPPPTVVQNKKIQQIIKAGWYLLELINRILEIAVIESDKLSLSREPVSMIEVMRECLALIESQVQQRDIRITLHPFGNTCIANADRTRVKQVMINLLSNAIKYNREHGTIEVTCTECAQDRIRISIKDSGEGLPPEKLAQLFQPFNRLGQETGNEVGTGIGLVVTKQLVELMGGAIGVESSVGMGSEFWFELIRDVMPQQATDNAMSAELVPQVHDNAARRTLLYVEDNPANLILVEQIIEGHPHMRMLSSRDGDLGIALARTHQPDVILMDINLPGISGVQVLKTLREDPLTSHIPVIAISANAMPHDIEKGLEIGFFRYLTKPIKVNELMETLDIALNLAEKN